MATDHLTLEDLKSKLSKSALDLELSDETLGDVLAAEAAAQRSRTTYTGKRPAELDEALLARVEHNLEVTRGETIARVGSRGPGVRDLEAAYSTRVSASSDDTTSSATPRKRAAKKRAPRTRKATAKATSSAAANNTGNGE